jgi:hypothetical protein
MKTRHGFVSNSSSSSFIVAINQQNACPHCGRRDVNLIDILKNQSCENDDTRYIGDKTYILEQLNSELHNEQKDLKSLLKRNPNEKACNSNWATDTVAKRIEYCRNDIQYYENLIRNIQTYKEVHEIKISYHDSMLNDMLKESVRTGSIIILNKNE